MNDTFGIEITYFGRPFRAGPGWPHPGLKPRLFLPLRVKTGGLFRLLGSLHPDGPETLGICLWERVPTSHGARIARERVPTGTRLGYPQLTAIQYLSEPVFKRIAFNLICLRASPETLAVPPFNNHQPGAGDLRG